MDKMLSQIPGTEDQNGGGLLCYLIDTAGLAIYMENNSEDTAKTFRRRSFLEQLVKELCICYIW